jgi:hypothetical protein
MLDTCIELYLSAGTLTLCYLTGDKSKYAPVLGLVMESSWLAYTVKAGLFGLMPLNIGLLILYIRMWYKWTNTNTNKEED